MTNGLYRAEQRFKATLNTYKPEQVSERQLEELAKDGHTLVVDEIDSLIEELFRVDNPAVDQSNEGLYKAELSAYRQKYLSGNKQNWFYYPWHQSAVHCLAEQDHYRLRTARNRNLITAEEQKKLAGFKIGVAGLSVGASAVAALAHTGIKHLRIADADELALSNLNRIRSGVHNIGLPKTTLAARAIYELDPYSEVVVYDQGITMDNLESFMKGLDILIDEMDDVSVKTQMRLLARKQGIPVLMATDNGDNVLIDIERYDLDRNTEIFHGLLTKDEVAYILKGGLSKQDWLRFATKLIDLRHAPLRLLQSVPLIGRELAGVPQIGSTAMFAGGVVAYTARMIALGQPVASGKHHVNLEATLRTDYPELEAEQRLVLQQIMEQIGT